MTIQTEPTLTSPALKEHSPKHYSIVLKMGAIILLGLLLLIPLSMVNSLLSERLARRDDAVKEITSTWGNAQVIFGPVLIVPYNFIRKSFKDQIVNGLVERVEVSETAQARAYFLPATLKIDAHLTPSLLHRGIYEAVAYSGTTKITGRFDRPAFAEFQVNPQQILWEDAELAISITDLRGAKESMQVKLGDILIPLKPGARLAGFAGGVYARVKGLELQTGTIPFEMALTFNGSRSLRFVPVGANNDVQLASAWPDPGFQGAFLPTERRVGPDGFDAHWQVSYYGRSYPQQWTDTNPVMGNAVMESVFGVDLVTVVDSYRFVERSVKYGILLIALMFTAFFLFEVMTAVRIHPFQYTLVGIALCLFYLALLALSEVISFGPAYWTGAAAATIMISLYSAKALRGGRRAGVVAAGLSAVYAFMFVILRLQDYSLLIGTAGLFLVLGIVMYVTRNLDWYSRDYR
ncbi:MAG TPA: cell envelope integrity protein CreD [Acidobacteriota bacterium]|nr:cell envelope integrity protein CreD [Acidobacteriota bacterium]